jgi:hypothetical protein
LNEKEVTPTDSAVVNEKITKGEVTVEGKNVKVPINEKTEKALKKKAKKEGKTPDKAAEEIIKENLQPNKFEGFVNPYGFLHLSQKLREAWQIKDKEKTDVTIELQNDGSLIIRKA